MKYYFLVVIFVGVLILFGCQSQPACPAETVPPKHLTINDIQNLPLPASSSATAPVDVEINGKLVSVNKVVDGPLCNDSWQGTVYVGCNVQVLEWEENPLFFKDCNLSIAEGTVVYVARHNNEAYYKGCSCHTGEQP